MTKNNEMQSETFSDEEWFDRLYEKSNSIRTKNVAKVSINTFDQFCQNQTGLNGESKKVMIEKYKTWGNQDKPDIRSICLSLDKFVRFMAKDHDDVYVTSYTTFKAKTSKTIKLYFGFIKSYLRVCHGIRITTEDIHDFVQFPKDRKEARRPISLSTLKLLFGKCDPTRRALYYVLLTSGMRLGEGLSLKKSSFDLSKRPIEVSLLADDTKTKEARVSYISSEAWERVKPLFEDKKKGVKGKTASKKKGVKGKPLFESKKDNEYLFHNQPNVYQAVKNEIKYFTRLRERLGLTEKYEKSVRHVVNIHSFRSYFITKASQKHGSDYSHALSGHGAYLKQYYREDPKERAAKYLTLEPSLLIESVKVEADKLKDKVIDDLQLEMEKMKAWKRRMELIS